MAHTLTVTTLWLAQAIGLYVLLVGIGMATRPGRMAAIAADIEAHPGLAYAFGALVFAIGAAILMVHHILYDWLSCVVTGIAVGALVEAMMVLAAPALFSAMVNRALLASRGWAIFMIVLGLFLFLAGFTGRADALP